LLIVEDHIEVRGYLKTIFEDRYHIVEAANGKEGYLMAIETIPDIIISDVMMPEIDGFKLCSKLKNDIRTSHIPVILLTAKAGEENMLKGTVCGAVDYVVKPFNEDLLRKKVENLLSTIQKLQKRYKQEVIFSPKDLAVSSIDEMFLEKVEKVLKSDLKNPDFDTESFARAVNMSRMQLYRKLKALTGLSTSEFIRSQRLKLAAELLKTGKANVSEIAYDVGFNSAAYFSKCFKKAYGCSPTEFAKKHSD
jgi:YesN/AraC family two-component response regulator